MTTTTFEFTTTGRRGVSRELGLLVDAARRGDVQVRRERRWDVYLVIVDPGAVLSLIVPAVTR